MITGNTTMLREFRASDLEALTAMRNDLEVQRLLLARPRPNTAERVNEWVTRLGDDPQAVLFVIASIDNGPMGFVQITSMDPISGHCRLGIALASEHQGRGYGREALELAASYLAATFSIRKIVLEVLADNDRAIGLYRSAGFRQVGVLAEHFKHDGTWSDVMIMERLLDS
jgi:RimJ/RimL family protein N-acetyltransferase